MTVWIIVGSALAYIIALVWSGIAVGRKYNAVDEWIDDKQRAINRIENKVAESGSPWLAELLEAMVVGDADDIVVKVDELITAENTQEFWLSKVVIPFTSYAFQATVDKPDLRKQLLDRLKPHIQVEVEAKLVKE